jgi:cation transport ATPase
MGSRERKRAERQKRKRRSAEHSAAPAPDAAPPPEDESFEEKLARRAEERNAQARAELEPLEQDERPTAVTVGAIASAILAIAISVQAVLSAAGVSAGGATTRPAPLFIFAAVLWLMAYGMWKARYWAVLGFQTLLLLMILASAFGLVLVSSVLQAIGTTLLLAASGTLFYFLIRALARIQMPGSPGAE